MVKIVRDTGKKSQIETAEWKITKSPYYIKNVNNDDNEVGFQTKEVRESKLGKIKLKLSQNESKNTAARTEPQTGEWQTQRGRENVAQV